MNRLGGWLRSVASPPERDAWDRHVATQARDIREAMASAQRIMDDDIDGAFAELQQGDSSFHELGASTAFFMRAVLGMEKAVMAETEARVAQCEARAGSDWKRAQRLAASAAASSTTMAATARESRDGAAYPVGTEYELVRAQAQLMGAVVGVLTESVPDAMRGFYKLRKAYVVLEGIANRVVSVPVPAVADSSEQRSGTSGTSGSGSGSAISSGISSGASSDSDSAPPGDLVQHFIHSGTSMSFGVLLLLLTLIPPAFSRILAIIGFRGDRPRGVRMLWRSTAYPNIYGAMAGLMLLEYYNGVLGAADILPAERDFDEAAETFGPPLDKRDRLLAVMRARYPASQLWRIEEARQLATSRRLREAMALLMLRRKQGRGSSLGGQEKEKRSNGVDGGSRGDEEKEVVEEERGLDDQREEDEGKEEEEEEEEEFQMRQIRALHTFEIALDSSFAQDWPTSRDAFLRCVEQNGWSHALYFYHAGCASLELYRDALHDDDEAAAQRHKRDAETSLRLAPTLVGRKTFMARQLPFERFLQRKLVRWGERAAELRIDLADAVGPSPAMELSYLWNGARRMDKHELARGLEALSWSRCTASRDVIERLRGDQGDRAVWAVASASLLRELGRYEEARTRLEEEVLVHDRYDQSSRSSRQGIPRAILCCFSPFPSLPIYFLLCGCLRKPQGVLTCPTNPIPSGGLGRIRADPCSRPPAGTTT